MKARILALSLLLIVGINMVGCSEETATNEPAKPENKTAAPVDDKAIRSDVITSLKAATDLLNQAKTTLEKNEDDSQAQVSRLIGYPAFLSREFIDSPNLVKKLNQNPGELSKYLLGRFNQPTKDLLKQFDEGAVKPDLVKALKLEFNEELRNKDLHDQNRFPDAKRETIAEFSRNHRQSPWKLARLNRFLLQDSYKQFIEPISTSEQTVVDLLEEAAAQIKRAPADQQQNYKQVTDALKSTESLLTDLSQASEEKPSASDIAKISDEVSAALKTLNPEGGSNEIVDASTWDAILEIVKYLTISVAIIIVVAGIAYLVHRARTKRAAERLSTQESFRKLFERHDKQQLDFTSFKSQHNADLDALKEQVSRLENAYQILSRKKQPATQPAGEFSSRSHGDGFYEPPPLPVKEEPEFPASAENYLERMKGLNRSTTVIRPDFQNGILIKDAEGRGELVLIEDPYASDWQPLIVVPSVSHFQMKQDFYNYYETYYDCDQPAAGNVWIVHPAFVEKVSGGWSLKDKGRLEVR